MLIALSFSAGAADSISITTLGAFTGAITGDVVLLGVSTGRGDPHDALRAGIALCGFSLGVFTAVRLLRGRRGPGDPPDPAMPSKVLAGVVLLQSGFLALWLATDTHPSPLSRDGLTILSALALGAQTATSLELHPTARLATTYITGTFTTLLSELATGGGERPDRVRRAVLVVAIAAGAAAGGLVLMHARAVVAAIPPVLSAVVALAALHPTASIRRGRSAID